MSWPSDYKEEECIRKERGEFGWSSCSGRGSLLSCQLNYHVPVGAFCPQLMRQANENCSDQWAICHPFLIFMLILLSLVVDNWRLFLLPLTKKGIWLLLAHGLKVTLSRSVGLVSFRFQLQGNSHSFESKRFFLRVRQTSARNPVLVEALLY